MVSSLLREKGDNSPLRNLSVLYVEDDSLVRDQLSQYLKRRVNALYTAANGREGLALFLEHKPALVITDVMMPEMDGLKMAEAIKAASPATPIIITTAFNETDFLLKAIDIGIDKYLIKPVKLHALERAIVQSDQLLRAELATQLATMVFDASPNAIIVTDADSRIVAVNPAFSLITGYAREEAIGQNPRLLNSTRQDQAFYRRMWTAIRRTGRWEGEIWNRRKNGELYPEWLAIRAIQGNNGETTGYVGMFSDISERKQAEKEVYHLANYDALTDLPNRVLLHDRLSQAMVQAHRQHTMVGVMFIDLDRFKVINDTLGHKIGDMLLKKVAARLKGCVREEDTVSRRGGDEFVILLPELKRVDDAVRVAQKILLSIAKPFTLDSHELHISASIGLSFYPRDGKNAETLMKNADVAMYRAKENGRDNYQVYHARMDHSSLERLALETSLRHALEREEFILDYQPQRNIHSGKIVGMEALLRWRHPELGMLTPDQFLPLAEQCGLILPINAWVLHTAIAQAQQWQAAGFSKLRLAVNISSQQFHQPDLLKKIGQLLKKTGYNPDYLELELTENALLRNAEKNVATLRKLRKLGVHIAIDDFGTGYSS
ncbi:MAG TPA: diguanylate cyclase, partial [Betaproteobacteria bacterium]|nr:diguanylate cyclase [Betaproteobacteria bacterium]